MLKNFQLEASFLQHYKVDDKNLPIVRIPGNGFGLDTFRLNETVTTSWIYLERELVHMSEVLFQYAAEYLQTDLPSIPFWPRPKHYGYRDVYRRESWAHAAARKAYDAFALLCARCSLAIALVTTDATAAVPQWVEILRKAGVPKESVDVLRQNIVSNLSPGL